MKRRLLSLAALLLLGAIVNVGVAWACALTVNPYKGTLVDVFTQTPNELCVVVCHARPGARAVTCNRGPNHLYGRTSSPSNVSDEAALVAQRRLLPPWTALARRDPLTNQASVEEDLRTCVAWGWPAVVLFTEFRFVNVNTFGSKRYGIDVPLKRHTDASGYESYQWNLLPVVLPLRPIWPGFAINTVFYAVGLWGLFAGPFVLRRRRRIRRGLCPKCAYDLRGRPQGSACPECGSIVAS